MPGSDVTVATPAAQISVRTRAMATDISITVALHDTNSTNGTLEGCLARAAGVFTEVDRTCSRFKPDSPLSRANAAPDSWFRVPATCFDSIGEAWNAYRSTGGLFDPRVLTDLLRLGYDRSLPFAGSAVEIRTGAEPAKVQPPRPAPHEWKPGFRPETRQVRVSEPIDLGGIGKGLAVRWASHRLDEAVGDYLVEAGGDCYCSGRAPSGNMWTVGVEDPADPHQLIAALDLRDRACTTSSIRLRNWKVDGVAVHHIIDPRTGGPGGCGLLSVTVVGEDPALSEVWSKTLFLNGAERIGDEAAAAGIAALWVTDAHQICMTAPMEGYVRWLRP